MSFRARNVLYLRISAHTILPLFLYLDDRHVEWMSDRTLQRVLADLRTLIIPKLRAEADAHFGPGAPANAKKGTVDVHRGDTYQFAFFFRKTEPHSVVVKARNFIAAPKQAQKQPLPKPLKGPTGKRKRTGTTETESSRSSKGGRRNRTKTKDSLHPKKRGRRAGKSKADDQDDDGSAILSSDDSVQSQQHDPDTNDTSLTPRRSGRVRKLIQSVHRQDVDGDEEQADGSSDVEMLNAASPLPPPPALGLTLDGDGLIGMHFTVDAPPVVVKAEGSEPALSGIPKNPLLNILGLENGFQEAALGDSVVPPATREAAIEEEEEKPKPVLQMNYQGFSVHGRCLCIVVEPWPAFPSASRAPSLAPMASRAPSIAPPEFVASDGTTGAGLSEQGLRARTPLFLPDFDRGRSITPAPMIAGTLRVLPPVPQFNGPSLEDRFYIDDEDAGLLEYSQVLNSVAGDRAGSLDDDDEMDGGVFFGDADEKRGLS